VSRNLLAILVPAAVAAAAVAAIATAQPGHAAVTPKPPVIHESFTPLPCSGSPGSRNTQQQLGCAEQQILRTDKQIDKVAKTVFGLLHDDAARRRLIAAQRSWQSYRQADCANRSDLFEGGSQAPVIAAACAADRNATRLHDLRTFVSDLSANGP
jgi:uncharacterized protein YecT (DUF1311 family)